MSLTKRADHIIDNWINGNCTDAIDMLLALRPEEIAIVAIIAGRDHCRTYTNGMISTLYYRMGIE